MKQKEQEKKITTKDLAEMIQKNDRNTRKFIGKEIESLALMTQKGFNDMEERLGGRISGVEQRLDGVDKRLDGVDKRLDGVEVRLGGVEDRLDNVVTDISGMKKEILNKLDKKVDKVEFVKLEGKVCALEKVAEKLKRN